MPESRPLETIQRSPRPVLVDVWAPWCRPCRRMEPDLSRLEQEYAGQVDVWRLNADQEPDLLQALDVMAVPTLILFRAGQEVARRTGAQGRRELEDLFASAQAGVPQPAPGVRRVDRFLRLAAGSALLLLAAASGPSWPLMGVGAVVLFSAVHDRCPLWRALAARWRAAGRISEPATGAPRQAARPPSGIGGRG